MGAAEIAADETTEETVGETNEAQNQWDVDALDEGEQTGVASQLITKLTEGAQAFLSLGHKVRVAFEGAEAHRIVDMGNRDVIGSQLFAKEYIFVAIIAETLVEGMGQHQVSADEEVSRMEVVIGILLALVCRMLMFCGLLIAIAEIALEGISITSDGNSSVDDISLFHHYILINKVGTLEGHVAVDEEQMRVLSLLGQNVADGCTADITGLSEELTMLPLADLAILTDNILIRRTVIGYQNLIVNIGLLSLLSEFVDQQLASVIVGRNEDRQCIIHNA